MYGDSYGLRVRECAPHEHDWNRNAEAERKGPDQNWPARLNRVARVFACVCGALGAEGVCEAVATDTLHRKVHMEKITRANTDTMVFFFRLPRLASTRFMVNVELVTRVPNWRNNSRAEIVCCMMFVLRYSYKLAYECETPASSQLKAETIVRPLSLLLLSCILSLEPKLSFHIVPTLTLGRLSALHRWPYILYEAIAHIYMNSCRHEQQFIGQSFISYFAVFLLRFSVVLPLLFSTLVARWLGAGARWPQFQRCT